MNGEEPQFEIPKNIERYMAVLSRMYEREGQRQLQEITVNSQLRVHEQWSYDNWNGGTYGHALYIVIPERLFNFSLQQKNELEEKILADLNKINTAQNEFVEKVFVELDLPEEGDWRSESGLLISEAKSVSAAAAQRIWGNHQEFRLFLSHKAEVKKDTSRLKEQLEAFGVSCFVAHVDIHPTKEWQDEIESALSSMDGFVALLTDKFHESDWTDQEVGFALARRVPIIAVRLGRDPYGFIGKFQGLSATWDNCARDIAKLLIRHDRMFAAYVRALRGCVNWNTGNMLGEVLPAIERLTDSQIDELVSAFNETTELRGCFAFNGKNARYYGDGLIFHLNRLATRRFSFTESGLIQEMKVGEP
jgi:TIR domain